MNSKLNAYKQAAMMKTDYRSQEANLFKRVTFGLIQGKANPNGMDPGATHEGLRTYFSGRSARQLS